MSRPSHFGAFKRHHGGNRKIRHYDYLGKFEGETSLTLAAYGMSLETPDCLSDERGGGNFTLLEGPFTKEELKDVYVEHFGFLNRKERQFIEKQKGCIVEESESGFVTATWFDDEKKLKKAWRKIEKFFEESFENQS